MKECGGCLLANYKRSTTVLCSACQAELECTLSNERKKYEEVRVSVVIFIVAVAGFLAYVFRALT